MIPENEITYRTVIKIDDKGYEYIACPVCGHPVITEDICERCGWQNLGTFEWGPTPNKYTLEEARENWYSGKPANPYWPKNPRYPTKKEIEAYEREKRR